MGYGINITVNKVDLLEKLRANRSVHAEKFQLALEGYAIEARKELEGKIKALEEGKDFDRTLYNVPPEDHTDDYDTVIEMMEMSIGSEVSLTQSQFQEYVRDDWGWKRGWDMQNTGYVLSASPR